MTPQEIMAKARELAAQLPDDPNDTLYLDWPKDGPDPETVAWVLAHMLAQTLPSASSGFARRSPQGEGATASAAAPSP